MRKLYLVALFLFTSGTFFSQPHNLVDSLYSESLNRTMPLSIIIPSDYNEQKPIPILYLLHGYNSNHVYFLKNTNINKYADENSVLCVMPQADNSWWINAHSAPEDKYEDYFVKDVTGYIKNKYNVDTKNQYIAGFSMGGYGAITLALRHPDQFSFAASITGALMYPGDTEILDTIPRYKFVQQSTDRVFGELPNNYRNQHDPFKIYKNISLEDLPYIFIFTGLQDTAPEVPAVQREFADSLLAYNAFYEYHELQGGHNSETVDASLAIFLSRISYLRNRYYKSLSTVLLQRYIKSGIERTIEKYHELKSQNVSEYNFREAELNILGYQLLQTGEISDAVKIFKLNVEQYPESPNVYHSLGEANESNNELEQAAENYKKAYNLGVQQSSIYVDYFKENLDRIATKLKKE